MVVKKTYSWRKTLWQGIRYALYYGLPYAIASFYEFYPQYMGLTVGTILTWVMNWLKNRRK